MWSIIIMCIIGVILAFRLTYKDEIANKKDINYLISSIVGVAIGFLFGTIIGMFMPTQKIYISHQSKIEKVLKSSNGYFCYKDKTGIHCEEAFKLNVVKDTTLKITWIEEVDDSTSFLNHFTLGCGCKKEPVKTIHIK